MNGFDYITINKNRGWRGLAEATVWNAEEHEVQLKMIFSFSQAVWDDMIFRQTIVMQDKDYYYIIRFKDNGKLPGATQQRSVLIKNYKSKITEVNRYEKESWQSAAAIDWNAITKFLKNKNNHTQSDWNCIGLRVMPEI